MAFLSHAATLMSGPLSSGARITDLEVRVTAGGTMLYAGTLPGDGTIMAFALAQGQTALLADSQAIYLNVNALGPTQIDFLTVQGGTAIIPTGRFGAEAGGFLLNPDGTIGASRGYSDGAGQAGSLIEMEVVRIAGTEWIYGAVAGGTGLQSWTVSPDGSSLLPQGRLDDGPDAYLSGVTALTSASLGGADYLFAVSPTEAGVTAMAVNADGSLTIVGRMGAAEGLGVAAPSAIDTVTMGSRIFAVVVSPGSSGISVLRLDPGGLVPVDHVTDSLSTRFQSPVALDCFTVGARSFVVTGGIDDGLSLFQMMPDGRLILIETLIDDGVMALSDIRSLKAVQVGSGIKIFVASASENGLTQITLTLPAEGNTLNGSAGADTMTGGAAADILSGGRGDDRLSGGNGDDFLIDGAGADQLTGGSGQDLFILMADGQGDTILDFDPSSDRLDLSDFLLLYSVAQVVITPTANGAILTYRDEVITIRSASGQPLTAADFSDDSVLNLPRSPVGLIISGRTDPGTDFNDSLNGTIFGDLLSGGLGNDTLSGGEGDDTLDGGEGADRLEGGAGSDWAEYGNASAGVVANLSAPQGNAGEAAGDTYLAVENLAGSLWDDRLTGDGGANEILGRAGNDTLSGGGGDDTLDGGAGDDVLAGGIGADVLIGGDGSDLLDFSGASAAVGIDLGLAAGTGGEATGDRFSGFERVKGSNFADTIVGSAGADLLDGGAGNDTIIGGGGDDTLIGGPGADHLDGGSGIDLVTFAGLGQGVLVFLSGTSGGDSFAGIEAVEGTDHADTITGALTADRLIGGAGNDGLSGSGGDDTLDGGDGNDLLDGGAGRDLFVGGAGFDTVTYSTSKKAVTVDLTANTSGGPGALGDRFQSVEGLAGGAAGDRFLGTTGAESFAGNSGNDRLDGRDGSDSLAGGSGTDTLIGGAGNDLLDGGSGGDLLDGGSGLDIASYATVTGAMLIDLAAPKKNRGAATGDRYAGIEGATGGSGNDTMNGAAPGEVLSGGSGNDRINGRGGSDTLRGGQGDDLLSGGDGDDALAGGAGADRLTGGTGSDSFVFLPGGGADTVTDFQTGSDILFLDASLAAGLDIAAFITLNATVGGASIVLDLGPGDSITLSGLTDLAALIASARFGDASGF